MNEVYLNVFLSLNHHKLSPMKTALLIIDMQNDFCNPLGSLYVPGAKNDVRELSAFIAKETAKINHIILTQDNHQVINIAHPAFWQNLQGTEPPPFTNITYNDILEEKWIPRFDPEFSKEYIRKLDTQGEYTHTIWPEHCLIGSEGAAIVPDIMNQVIHWARTGKFCDILIKGTHPFTEHFGAFRANIPVEGAPETQLNHTLIKTLRTFDTILVAGEAQSHCVANTIKQLFDFPDIMKKLIILTNCMSNITNYELIAQAIYDKAVSLGTTLTTTHDITL